MSVPLTSAAVTVSDLAMRYGDRTVVDQVSWQAGRGQVTALLGPNGAGKTTTVECCVGLRRPTTGEARVLGADPWRAGAEHRARVGVMLQDGGLPTAARAGEVLALVAAQHADPLDSAQLLTALGLTEHARTAVRRLSGGQRQRLALAVALIGRPELLFLDEPTAGLDPQARHAVWNLVADARTAGVAVVLTTHAMDEAERLADHIVVMNLGRIVADTTPAELTDGGRRSLESVFLELTGSQLR